MNCWRSDMKPVLHSKIENSKDSVFKWSPMHIYRGEKQSVLPDDLKNM